MTITRGQASRCCRWLPATGYAWVILGHTLVLSIVALMPAWYSMGPIYLTGAVIGGGLFTWTSIALVLRPDRQHALKNFLASLVQLCLLLSGALADRVLGQLL